MDGLIFVVFRTSSTTEAYHHSTPSSLTNDAVIGFHSDGCLIGVNEHLEADISYMYVLWEIDYQLNSIKIIKIRRGERDINIA